MSITNETLQQHLKDPAVFCCRRQKGLVIGAADLEDPTLLDELAETGVLQITGEGLTIEQVIGRTLQRDVDALTSITADMLDGVNQPAAAEKEQPPAVSETKKTESERYSNMSEKTIHVAIERLENLKNLTLDIPVSALGGAGAVCEAAAPVGEPKINKTLIRKHFAVKDAVIADHFSFENGVLTLDGGVIEEAMAANDLVKSLTMDVIRPNERHIYTETIMDVVPIATKVEGELGNGLTHIMDGVVFMLTGVDEDGVQVHEFGSSEGWLDEHMVNEYRAGNADVDEIIIRVHAVVQKGTGMERRGPVAAHTCQDVIIQKVRDVLKTTKEPVVSQDDFTEVRNTGKPRVVLVKEIMGQGAMHDNVIYPTEPAGVEGGRMNVDLGNVPVIMTPNVVIDGGIHALCCIGPGSKEMTRHYFREPIMHRLIHDEELELAAVIFVGSPQVTSEKFYVSKLLGTMVECLDVDGAIVTTEGDGNNHIDFASHIEEIGKRGIPVVGVTWSAYMGQLVVGNKYMDAMVETNKHPGGVEVPYVSYNNITDDDAKRAILMLKTKMMGIEIGKTPFGNLWKYEPSHAVQTGNQELADPVYD